MVQLRTSLKFRIILSRIVLFLLGSVCLGLVLLGKGNMKIQYLSVKKNGNQLFQFLINMITLVF